MDITDGTEGIMCIAPYYKKQKGIAEIKVLKL